METRAVIFDRDNTLLRLDPAAVERLERRIATIAPALPPRAATMHWMSWPGPWPRTAAAEPQFWDAFWETLGESCALPPTVIDELRELGPFYHTCFVTYPDARPCLEALRARGLQLAVLTNYELPSVDLPLRHAGLDPSWFSALLSSSAIGFKKPDARAYQATLAALGLQAGQCTFVDDRPENVAAARSLGMRGILLDRAHAARGGETIGTLDDLPGLL